MNTQIMHPISVKMMIGVDTSAFWSCTFSMRSFWSSYGTYLPGFAGRFLRIEDLFGNRSLLKSVILDIDLSSLNFKSFATKFY